MKLYEPLYRHLSAQAAESVRMSFAEIERLIGRELPATARSGHSRQWWANSDSHVQARAWLKARRKASLDIARSEVTFRRMEPDAPRPLAPAPAGPPPKRLQLNMRSLHPATIRMIQDMAEENGLGLDEAAARVLNQIALRRRRETLDWFTQNTMTAVQTSADLIRADRDG